MPMITAIRRMLIMIQGGRLSVEEIAKFAASHDFRIALAGLLVHAGNVDGAFVDVEKHFVRRLLVDKLGISSTDAAELMILVNHKNLPANDMDELVAELAGKLGPEGRADFVDWLWQLVIADNVVTEEEAALVAALAGKIGVDAQTQAAIAAKHRAGASRRS
jgi:uncharacterized tellurite resistance protein B-like protein